MAGVQPTSRRLLTEAAASLAYVTKGAVGAAGGPAGPLDSGGKIPVAQIPPVTAALGVVAGSPSVSASAGNTSATLATVNLAMVAGRLYRVELSPGVVGAAAGSVFLQYGASQITFAASGQTVAGSSVVAVGYLSSATAQTVAVRATLSGASTSIYTPGNSGALVVTDVGVSSTALLAAVNGRQL